MPMDREDGLWFRDVLTPARGAAAAPARRTRLDENRRMHSPPVLTRPVNGEQVCGDTRGTRDRETNGAPITRSDGPRRHRPPADLPGLLQHPSVVVAAQLLRHAGTHRDDAGAVVARGRW